MILARLYENSCMVWLLKKLFLCCAVKCTFSLPFIYILYSINAFFFGFLKNKMLEALHGAANVITDFIKFFLCVTLLTLG